METLVRDMTSFWAALEGMFSPFSTSSSNVPQHLQNLTPVHPSSSSILPLDIVSIQESFQKWTVDVWSKPDQLQSRLETLGAQMMDVCHQAFEGSLLFKENMGKPDPRFASSYWQHIPAAHTASHLYVLMSTWMFRLLKESQLDDETQQQALFWLKQWIDAQSPSNFPWLNPDVVMAALSSEGVSLQEGFRYWLEDTQKDAKEAFLSLTKPKGFEVGKNLALTEGKVIFQNEFMQLIQYKPRSETTFSVPLLIIPPWINKFYLFDMRPENSFVKWALDQGHEVFMISWANPRGDGLNYTFEDYLLKGFIPALDRVLSTTGASQAHLMGLCVGGNLLSCALGYLKATNQDKVASATLLATLMDFHEVGDLGVFLGKTQFQALKRFIEAQGMMDGHLMALTFSLLRANEMIWRPLVNRYFLGKPAQAFDFLFWNGDPLRIPGPLHLFLLEQFFHANAFKAQGGVTLGDIFCDWTKVDVPRFTLASLKDHIAPWKACFPLAWGQNDDFIVSTSGHIAGVINPPEPQKYGYWSGGSSQATPEEWMQTAQETAGSWWSHWQKWVTPFSGEKGPTTFQNTSFTEEMENAPGSYVTEA